LNHWPFILGSYAATIVATLALGWQSYAAMKRAEAEADSIGRDR
jgi:hypothetical protein